ncbi:MAG TPA: CRTAC1 family protein [Chthonomonadaceae bacterium]|nr:CRTAC1 family protein [Chthonomonadaceae bacterium]
MSPLRQAAAATAPALPSPPLFQDVADRAGLHYRWTIPGKRPLNILQTIGNGCAFLDYNNDGNLDILLVGPNLALYQGDGHGHFTDVTHETGLDTLHGHFLGCAVGDYDNDGYDDIYLSGYRTGLLMHNEHGQGFRDVTREAGLAPQPWGTSATFFDADDDGKLDLYIGDYVQFGPQTQPQLCNYHGVMAGCAPTDYRPLRGVLYHNLGGGRFQDVTHTWGLDRISGRTLGVAAAPFGPDGRPALAIANDETPGDLIVMRGAKSQNIGVTSGIAYAGTQVYGGMGIDWGDYDNDGRLDLVIATFQNQGKLVIRNQGAAFAIQDTGRMGMFSSLGYVAFGAKWLDYDNDGWLDLLFANGHIQDNADQVNLMNFGGSAYRQPLVLYHSLQGKRFEDTSAGMAAGARRPIVGRGLAIGDFDNDGRMDALVVDSEGQPLLLHNVTPHAGHWLLVNLVGTKCNRDGYGAILTVETGGRKLKRFCHADGSYLSSSDKRVHFGLGTTTKIERLQVRWPDGHVDTFHHLPVDRILQLKEGAAG